MIVDIQKDIADALIKTGLIKKVYHSVQLIEDKKGVKFPAYKVGDEQFDLVPDDSKDRLCYIRQTGKLVTDQVSLEGSCSSLYKMKVPLRIVVFKDHEKDDFESITLKLLTATFLKNINLASVSNNAYELGRQECPVSDFNFDATTFYIAIDVIAKFSINSNMCEIPACIVHPNPFCL